jgi:hypothetical protein
MSSPADFWGGFLLPEMQEVTYFIGDSGWIRTSDLQLRRLLVFVARVIQ